MGRRTPTVQISIRRLLPDGERMAAGKHLRAISHSCRTGCEVHRLIRDQNARLVGDCLARAGTIGIGAIRRPYCTPWSANYELDALVAED